MPLPTPNSGESEKDFVSRCMGAEGMNSEFPEQKQRAAVCYSQWRKSKGQKATKTLIVNGLFQLKKLADHPRIIGGYASVPVIDADGDLITLDALRDAWESFVASEYPILSLAHEDIPLGKVIPEYTDQYGIIHKSGVDSHGLYIVGEVREDAKIANEAWNNIQLWGGRGAFSISAGVLQDPMPTFVDGNYHRQYGPKSIELHAIGIGREGANPMATFNILKMKKKARILVVKTSE